MSICVYHMHRVCRDQKRALTPLDLEPQVAVSCHMEAGNWIRVLSKISKCPNC